MPTDDRKWGRLRTIRFRSRGCEKQPFGIAKASGADKGVNGSRIEV